MIPDYDLVHHEIDLILRKHKVKLEGYKLMPVASTKEELIRAVEDEIIEICDWFDVDIYGDMTIVPRAEAHKFLEAMGNAGADAVAANADNVRQQMERALQT